MTRVRAVAVLLLAVTAGACTAAPPNSGAELRMVPDTEEVLDVLFRSEAVPMSVHPSCQRIADRKGVATIGAFVATLLARQVEGGGNWTSVSLSGEAGPEEMLWRIAVTFRGNSKSPGVDFLIRPSTRRVIPESFRCRSA